MLGRFCTEFAGILQIIGWILTIVKIAIPLLLIVFGIFDFGKAVVESDDDAIKKQAQKLGRRAAAGVIIFFIPTIVMWLFREINYYDNLETATPEFENCETCILHPWNCKVKDPKED